MGPRALAAFLSITAAASFGCVQRAVLLPIVTPMLTNLSLVSRPTPFTAVTGDPGQSNDGGPANEAVERFAIHAEDSTLEVRGGDLLTGMHVMRFARWRGAFFLPAGAARDKPSGRLVLDVDLASLDTDAVVDESLRNHLLEVDKHPRARFAGILQPRADRVEGYVFQGRLALHGVEKAIRFYVELRRSGDGYRISSEFDMSRDAFHMHRKDTLDLVIYDDFRVLVDLIAHAERVSAEVVPAE